MRKYTIIALTASVLILLFAFTTAHVPVMFAAQATPAAGTDCDVSAVIASANALKSSGDQKKDWAALNKLGSAISQANIACNGYTFNGKAGKVIGPLDFKQGVYKAVATTKGYFITNPKPIGKECGETFDGPTLDMNKTSGTDTEEAVLTVPRDCRMAIEVKNVTAPWTLTFEPLQ